MSNKRSMKQYRRYGADILNRDVFRKIRFLEKDMRTIVYDSYMLNLDPLLEYATANHLHVKEYLTEIKDILLASEHVYIKER